MGKAIRAMKAKARAARASMGRIELLKAHRDTKTCTCPEAGLCYKLMKDVLHKNGLNGSSSLHI